MCWDLATDLPIGAALTLTWLAGNLRKGLLSRKSSARGEHTATHDSYPSMDDVVAAEGLPVPDEWVLSYSSSDANGKDYVDPDFSTVGLMRGRLLDILREVGLADDAEVLRVREILEAGLFFAEYEVAAALLSGEAAATITQRRREVGRLALTPTPSPEDRGAERARMRADSAAAAQLLPNEDELLADTSGLSNEEGARRQPSIDKLKILGLLAHLSADELAEGRVRAVRMLWAEQPGSLWRAFPRSVVFFDWESMESDGRYGELLGLLARASRGHVALTEIHDDSPAFAEPGTTHTAGFTLSGTAYEFENRGQGDWLDTRFLKTLKRALREQGIPGGHYVVIDDGQANGLAFLLDEEVASVHRELPGLLTE